VSQRYVKDRVVNLHDRPDDAYTLRKKQTENTEYRKLDREVKRSCRKDKKDWIKNKCTEAQEEAAARNDRRN